MAEEEQLILPIIDSHVHLYRAQDVESFNWWKPDLPLAAGAQFLPQYKRAVRAAPSLLGFIFVEADRKFDLGAGDGGGGWDEPLREVALMRRVALGKPEEGDEGLEPEDGKLCLALVPWAPVPSGPAAMEKYLERVKEEAGDAWPKVKGFRYLVQDKPHGTMLEPEFIESLKLLGRRGFVFEVGVDAHRRGKKQMDELVAMIDTAHEGVPEEDKVTFVISTSNPPSFNTIYLLPPCEGRTPPNHTHTHTHKRRANHTSQTTSASPTSQSTT